MRVCSGSVFDVVVDLRRSSPSFGAWWGVELSAENQRMLWVPPGLAHGILVTSPSADFLYKCTDYLQSGGRAHARVERAIARHQVAAAGGRRARAIGQGRPRQEPCRHREIRMRVLVLGAGGQVAQAVARVMSGQHELFARTRAEVDIADAESLDRALAEAKADWIVNGGAYTAVDLAEDEAASALRQSMTPPSVSWLRPRPRARAGCCICRRTSSSTVRRIVRICRSDPPNPLSVYGASKLAGEKRALDGGCAAIVLRTAWVYAAAGKNFVLTMLRLMREREQVRVVAIRSARRLGPPESPARSATCSRRRRPRGSITGPISAWRAGTTLRWRFKTRRSSGAC